MHVSDQPNCLAPSQLGSSLELTFPCLASLCRLMTCRGKISRCKTALELCFHTVQPELGKVTQLSTAPELCFHAVQPELILIIHLTTALELYFHIVQPELSKVKKTVLELCFHTVQPELRVGDLKSSTTSLRTDFRKYFLRKYFQEHFRWREGGGFFNTRLYCLRM